MLPCVYVLVSHHNVVGYHLILNLIKMVRWAVIAHH